MEESKRAEQLVALLKNKKLTLAFAESCTGGLASATVVAVPSASEVFYGGIVSYDNSVKENLLSVAHSTLESVGAVSAECAYQMAQGARKAVGTDISVSVTGIAGPGGGSAEKPVGLVYLGIDSAQGTRTVKLLLGDKKTRTEIRLAAVSHMLCEAIAEAEN